jgi:colanic acid/amylovoran biosynthesis glycosyltransferase
MTVVTAHGFEVLTLAFVLEPDRYRLPEDYPLLAALADRGARFETFPYWETVEKKIRWLLSRIEAFRPAVFIPNFTVAGLYATAWTRPAGLPTVGMLHSDDAHYRALLDVFVAGQPRFRATDVVAVSRYLTGAAQVRATPETAVHSIPYGVPLPATVSGWTQGPLRLLYAGRLEEEQKRISDVTRALCRAAQLPNVTATIAGDGQARASVESIISREGHGRVQYVGLVDNTHIQALMAEHHVFVLLSDYEGLPIALMEAMATGLVPICTAMRSGIGQLVVDGVTGCIVADRGEGFVAAVRQLATRPEDWARFSRQARQHIVASGYDSETCLRQWVDLLTRRSREATYRGQPLLHHRRRQLGLPAPHPALEEDQWREPPPLVYYSRVARAKLRAAARRWLPGSQPAAPR